jgi:hypothetical protein
MSFWGDFGVKIKNNKTWKKKTITKDNYRSHHKCNISFDNAVKSLFKKWVLRLGSKKFKNLFLHKSFSFVWAIGVRPLIIWWLLCLDYIYSKKKQFQKKKSNKNGRIFWREEVRSPLFFSKKLLRHPKDQAGVCCKSEGENWKILVLTMPKCAEGKMTKEQFLVLRQVAFSILFMFEQRKWTK